MKLQYKFLIILASEIVLTNFLILALFFVVYTEVFDLAKWGSILLYVALITACVIFVTIYFFSKTFILPIQVLKRAMEKLSNGDFTQHMGFFSDDEIGEVSHAFNSMAATLEKSYRDFENRVRQKTLEYDKKYQELERFNKTMVGRELQMIELKKQIDQLRKRLGDTTETFAQQQEAVLAQEVNLSEGDVKHALLNVLEDLERTKERIEHEKVEDEAILSSIGDGMIATDEQGKITIMNRSAEMLLGWKAGEVIDKPIEEVIPAEYENEKAVPKPDIPVYVALLTREKVVSSTTTVIYYLRKDKTKFPAAITVTPVVIKDKVVGTITIFRDITREKEVDQMKTEFISLASHQLRTPLSAIKWFTEMLLDGDAGALAAEQKEMVDNVHQSNERMLSLVNSLLNISRIESGRIIIDPKPTDLPELIKEVVSDVKVRLDQKKQQLIFSVNDQLPKITIDPKLIRQVYLNLLTNASKYTPEGGEITIFLSRKHDQIISQISDNGFGIPQKEQWKVFQKFYRGENIVKKETDGNGLGLYLVKAIVESSLGKIWFYSEEGKGTTFWLSLPLAGVEPKKGEVTID